MDYGKMAYIKLTEMEMELAKNATTKPVFRSAHLDFEAENGDIIRLFKVNTSSFILNLQLFGGEIGTKLHLLANDKRVSTQNYGENVTFSVSLDESVASELSLEVEGSVRILRAEILLFNGRSDEGARSVALAKGGGQIALARVVSGQVRLHIFEQEIEDFLIVGFGGDVDIAACVLDGQGCFAVTYCDFFGNAYLVFVSKSQGVYTVLDARLVSVGAKSVSVSSCGDRLFVGFTSNGKGYLRSIFDFDSGVVDDCEVVHIVNNTNPPVIIVEKNGNLSIKLCESELILSRAVSTNAQIYVG